MSAPVLLVPGYGDSGPRHWQSRWQRLCPRMRRVCLDDWDNIDADVFVDAVVAAVAAAGADVVVVAHSLGVHAAVRAVHRGARVGGLLLVAPPDPRAPAFPPSIRGFHDVDVAAVFAPAVVVVSVDDPYVDVDVARGYAAGWGADVVEVGVCGHINSATVPPLAPHGRFRVGVQLLQGLRARVLR